MTQVPLESAWHQLRSYVIEHCDELSGWGSSTKKLLSERHNIFRDDDGLYYERRNGQLFQVIGGKTFIKARLDFITDHLIKHYGNLRLPLRLFALFGISGDFKSNSSAYPRAMKAVLTEPRWQNVSHHWTLQYWDRTRTVK